MNDEQQATPVEETENVATNVEETTEETPENGTDTEAESVPSPAPKQENMVTIPVEKLMDYKRKINGSKDEAMRLKAEKERLEAELAARSTVTARPEELEYFKVLAKQAGFVAREDLEQLTQTSYEDEKRQAVATFLEKHPEYADPGNPQSDVMWETLEEEIAQYVAPQRGKDYLALMEKVHRHTHYNPEVEREKGKALGMAQAKIDPTTTVGGGQRASAPIKKGAQAKKAVLDGFAQVRPQAFTN